MPKPCDNIEQITAKILRGSSRSDQKELIPILHSVQREFGFVPEKCMHEVARFLGLPESKVYGVATFYSQFNFSPQGKYEVKVCLGTACHVKGGLRLMETLQRELGIRCGETTPDRQYSLKRVNCVGSCALAPVVMVGDRVFGRMEARKVREILK